MLFHAPSIGDGADETPLTLNLSSDRPFVFDEPTRHIEGEGFTSDPDFKVVTAVRPKGTGGKFTLPNQ